MFESVSGTRQRLIQALADVDSRFLRKQSNGKTQTETVHLPAPGRHSYIFSQVPNDSLPLEEVHLNRRHYPESPGQELQLLWLSDTLVLKAGGCEVWTESMSSVFCQALEYSQGIPTMMLSSRVQPHDQLLIKFDVGHHEWNAHKYTRVLERLDRLPASALSHVQCPLGDPSDVDEVILVYPLQSPGSISITNRDILRLEPGEYLNDTLIQFGLTLWLEELSSCNPAFKGDVHIFSTFFYKKLKEKENFESAYKGVQKWTNKVDIFKKRYLFFPIHEVNHWYLAIISMPAHVSCPARPQIGNGVATPPDPEDPHQTTHIFILDSLGFKHGETFHKLASYLKMEAKYKKKLATALPPVWVTVSVPEQTNTFDCGIYLLQFAKLFMTNPEQCCAKILSQNTSSIWDTSAIFNLREMIKMCIRTLSAVAKIFQDPPTSGRLEDDVFSDDTVETTTT